MMRDHSFWNQLELEESGLFVGRGSLKFDTRLRVTEVGRHICFGGGKGGGGSSSPDPQVGKAALMQAKTGEDWLTFSREQFDVGNKRQEKIDALTNEVTGQQLSDMRKASDRSDDQWERYNTLFKPIEDRMVSDAANYDTPEAQAKAAAEAKADVMSSAAESQGQNQRQMASMGIDPRSGRFAGVDRGTDLSVALASAGAQNGAREQVKATGMALREGVANFGRGNTATAAQQVGLGLNAGNSATANIGAANQQFQSNNNVMAQGFQGAQQGYTGQANTLTQQRQQNIAAKQNSDGASAAGIQGVATLAMTGAVLF
ncbi:hypothetical protein D3C87_1255290 [compost metagenome]